jgi:hypothetical protein
MEQMNLGNLPCKKKMEALGKIVFLSSESL